MSYRSEADFSAALIRALKGCCPFIQRIESGTTGKGIPDLYLRFPKREVWVELKNDRYASIYGAEYMVDWRRGQQAWHLEYFHASGLPVITVVAMRDGFVFIPLRERYLHNIVNLQSVYLCTKLSDIVRLLHDLQRRG
jgi:hypothetical protein